MSATKKSTKKTKKTRKKASPLEANAKRLVTRGKKQGYLTLDDVLAVFPEAEENIELLDQLYTKLLDSGVDVFDVASEEVSSKKAKVDKISIAQVKLDKTATSDPVRMYLREIGRHNLLTAAEEVELAKRNEVFQYDAASKFIEKQTGKKANDTQIAEKLGWEDAIVKEVKKNSNEYTKKECIEANKKLTQSNLRLVVSIAKKYMGRGLQFLDLIQEGNIGLTRAVTKFNWRRGFKFSTYATWWIRQAITRAIADQAKTIRIPVHMVETINKYKKIERQLEQKLERKPTPEEVAKIMEIDVEKAHGIVKISQDTTSLETPVGKEEDTRLKEFIEDDTTLSPFDSASRELLKGHIGDVLTTLNDREKKVLELRFGLTDGRTRTLEEVGREFGVTRERIRQIEAKALRKLRHPSRSKRLKDYL